jgi:N-acetylglucosaminyldiphosphoundecaprenol N-acetyl-beta-D-mannosaminyltransferase
MARLNQAGKPVTCVGCEFPGFGSVEDMSRPEVIERINAVRPDLLVVSLGARKGQAWIERNRHRLDVPVISHLGAVVDFAAGTVARAPAWMQHTGLEWLWRIKEHPELWRRYLRDGVALARLVITRVFPSLWRRAPARDAAGRIEAKEAPRTFFIRLEGAWQRVNLAPLRECLAQASLSGKDVRLDLGRVTYMDSAALGLLMLLEGHQREQGRSFSIASLPEPVRRLFDYSCADYLYKAPRRALAPYAVVEDEELVDEVR